MSLKFKGKGFTNSDSLTSLPTMELLTLMYMLITSHTLISKQKMIAKLEEAPYNIQFEQHWLEAQTDRKAIGTV
ncbi:hypothetical protein CMV_011810 [Castanea mollissima]|uniref:Uncharacterized protein n=1 Tax=Castanea mollissima TaxID=60419 RepID=A0A8J4VNG5_9ROSI|nr:hypothetical protein CMV_011810 [Castanea mollissima]